MHSFIYHCFRLTLFSLVFLINPVMAEQPVNSKPFGVLDPDKFIQKLPEQSDRIVDHKTLFEGKHNGIRVFRIYNPVPAHYHEGSDTIVYLLEGEVSVAINQGTPQRVKKGALLHWSRGIVHAIPEIHSGTATFFAIDTPKRDPADTVFIDGKDVEVLQ